MSKLALADVQERFATDYVVERELGRGGMGAVFLARDIRLDRCVAIKVLPEEFARDAERRERFLRESQLAARFTHPNIVPVHAVDDRGGLLAYVMAYVEGESLAQRVERNGPLSMREAVRLLQDVGFALAYAHGRGVVHRDIKPENVLIERATGRAVLMDFGIARSTRAAEPGDGLTRIGEVVGTPEYMSPEQASGESVDGRSDLYALGLVGHFALSGRTAMRAATPQRVLARQLTEPPSPLSDFRSDVPPALAAALERCLAKDRQDRFPTAEAFVEALDLAQRGEPEIPLAVRLFASELNTLGLVLAFVAIIMWLLWPRGPASTWTLDSMIPSVVLLGVIATRLIQATGHARGLLASGFAAIELQRGLGALVAERADQRAMLAKNPAALARRRRSLVAAGLCGLVAILCVTAALALRTRLPDGSFRSGYFGATLVFSGMALVGVTTVLLVRSPFRTPPGEALFRATWLGPLGRALLRVASMGEGRRASAPQPHLTRAQARRRSQSADMSTKVATGDRLARLESRVSALESKADGETDKSAVE